MKRVFSIALLAGFLLTGIAARSQDSDRIVINFSDPSRPGLLKVNLLNTGIVVRSHSGKDVIIESSRFNRNRRTNVNALNVEEENNVMTVTALRGIESEDLRILVPTRTNLSLKTVNGGALVVEGVEGEIEVTNSNGSIQLNNVAGSVVAHASNGRVVASLREITPNKPMWFTSLNDNVDITLPSNAKANLKIRADNGETISDFEIQLAPGTLGFGRTRGRGSSIDRTMTGTINGGGPDFELRTLNGNIYIRKGK
jgi:DUF4097 and DUF4098 domain-containing protein YvlB